MDDLNEKLAGILNDPESMKRVRQMAENLLGNSQNGSAEDFEQNPQSNLSDLFSGQDMPDASQLKILISLANRLKNDQNDNRTALLKALRPHLSEQKREKVDTAIKLLRLIDILPYLKESGLLSL